MTKFNMLTVGLLAATTWGAQATTPAQARAMGGCTIYPANNIWNTPIDTLPVDTNSATYIKALGSSAALHADFAAEAEYGIPYNIISDSTAKVPIIFSDTDDSNPGPYPIPAGALVEQGDDHHLLLLTQAPGCELYEMYSVAPYKNGTVGRTSSGSVKAYAGDAINIQSNTLRPITSGSDMGENSADAAGMEILPALLRYDEVASGQITHALRFTAPETRAAYVWPARHYASDSTSSELLPMGARIRLKASVVISGYSKANQVILQAMKTYGMMLADNGSALYVSGAPDSRWDDDDLGNLGNLTASDFEVVSMSYIASKLEYNANSGEVNPAAKITK